MGVAKAPAEDRPERNQAATERLARAVEQSNRLSGSWTKPIWQGILSGIGSTIGLALALYALSLIIRPLQYLPVVGSFIRDQIQPAIDQKTGTAAPAGSSVAPTSSTPAADTATGTASLNTNYFKASLPGSWSIKLTQSSSSAELLHLDATRTGATVTVSVAKHAETVDRGTVLDAAEVTVDGERGTRRHYKASGTAQDAIDLQLTHGGDSYRLAVSYDPATVDGQAAFQALAGSFKFN